MVPRLIALASVLFMTTARAQPVPGPPEDLWSALAGVRPVEPWLARLPGCALASAEVFGPFRPYACFPPLSATVGLTPSGEVLSFESPSQPACGDELPSRLERWSTSRAAVSRVELTKLPRGVERGSDEALAGVLSTVFAEGMRAASLGFGPPSSSSEAASFRAGDVSLTAALVLPAPLEGQLLWLDLEGKRVMLSTPSRSSVLGRIPAARFVSGKVRPSLIEAVVSPDGGHLIVRLEGLSGTPCDPAALQRLVLEVPQAHRNGEAWPSPVGDTMRRCQGGERPACERLCDAGHCRPLALMGALSAAQLGRLAKACREESALDCAALRVLAQETCRREGQDSERCQAVEAVTDIPVMVKGGPPTVEPWRRLMRACEAGEAASCDELVTRFESQPFRIPKEAAVNAHRRLVDLLTRRCAMIEAACPALEEAKRRAP